MLHILGHRYILTVYIYGPVPLFEDNMLQLYTCIIITEPE